MKILFIRFGWFMLGAFFGAWFMSDPSRASSISSSINCSASALSDFVINILDSIK